MNLQMLSNGDLFFSIWLKYRKTFWLGTKRKNEFQLNKNGDTCDLLIKITLPFATPKCEIENSKCQMHIL